MIDTHTHLYLKNFESDLDDVLSRAFEVGVEAFYLPAIDSGTHEAMLALADKYPDRIFPMIGLHPTSVKSDVYEEELGEVRRYLETRDFRAIGEIGIDLYWDKTTLDMQCKAFRRQIEWALEFDKPIVIHSRDSIEEVIGVLEYYRGRGLRGIFHCFTGNVDQGRRIIDLDFKLGIGGVVTFKNSGLDKVVAHLPIEAMVLETDAPFLTPTPHRGKRNESSYLRLVCDKIAEIKSLESKDVDRITSSNAREVFGK